MAASKHVRQLLIDGLQLLYAAHHQGADQAAVNVGSSSLPELKRMLRAGSKANLQQARRLERVFATLGLKAQRNDDRAMVGIIDANNGLIARSDARIERDLANISYGQLAAHYYIATYGTLRAYAAQLDNRRAVRLLDKTLAETRTIDKSFSRLATRIMRRANQPGYPQPTARPALKGAAVLGSLAVGTLGLALLSPPKPKPRRLLSSWRR